MLAAVVIVHVLLTACAESRCWCKDVPACNQPAWGGLELPAPVLLRHSAGWGSAATLPDGTLLTAGHVFERFPCEANGEPIRAVDILRRPQGTRAASGARRGSFSGDWALIRVTPPPPAPSEEFFEPLGKSPAPGARIVIRGFARSGDGAATPRDHCICARVIPPPSWVSDAERHLVFAEAERAAYSAGMSGGPVYALDEHGRGAVFLGIFLGRVEGAVLMFKREVLAIQPWPPREPD